MALARVRVSNDMNEKLNVQFIIFFLQRLCSICPEEIFCEEHFDDRKNIRMKLSVLAALLASCDAVHQESKQHQLVATKSKLST